MKKTFVLASLSFVLGFVLGVLLGRFGSQNIVVSTSTLHFQGPGSPPTLDPLTLELEPNDKLIWAAVGGGAGDAKPANVASLPGTWVWQTMKPGGAAQNRYVFQTQVLANQVAGKSYSVVVLAGYSEPGLLGLWRNITFEARLFHFQTPPSMPQDNDIRKELSEPLPAY